MSKNKKDKIAIALISAIIGIFVFMIIYGTKIINPVNDDWLLSAGGDITCPYLGWVKYRETPWKFPIGLVQGVLEPDYACITYTDSIPLFAVIFKMIDTAIGLPDTFQYWGIWGMFCFEMGGAFGSLIIYEKTKSRVYSICGSLLFILSPLVIYRMYMHTALAGQWIVLAAIYIFSQNDITIWKKNIFYTIVCVLAALIHIYFIPMVVIILCADILRTLLRKRGRILHFIAMFLIPVCTTLFFMWGLGCFYQKGGELSDAGLGYHSFNINGLINSTVIDQWWFGQKTKVFHGLPQIFGQYEGFAYLGAGILLACGICVIFLFIRRTSYQISKKELIALLFLISCCILLALSPTVSIGERILFVIPWPAGIIKFLSIFRASGRLIWPVYYLIIIYTVCLLFRLMKNKRDSYIILFICLGIQIYDFSDILFAIHSQYTQNSVYASSLSSSCWQEELSTYDHVVFLGYQPYDNNIGVWAIKSGLGVNDFYMARKNEDTIEIWKDRQLENIRNNKDIDATIYVFSQEANIWRESNNLNYYLVDGYVIGIKGTLDCENAIALTKNESIEIQLGGNQFLTNGIDTAEGRVIYYGGVSIGPFIYLDKGQYRIKIQGSGFQNAAADVFSFEIYNNTQNGILFTLNQNENNMTIEFTLDSSIDDFQVRVYNNGSEDSEVVVNRIFIYKDNIFQEDAL